jgi:hypothetical protein
VSGLWRVSTRQPRNIYLDNVMVGVMVGAEGTAAALARAVVNTMNGGDLRPVGRHYGGYPSGVPTGKAPDVPRGPAPGMRTCGVPGPDGIVCQRKPGHGPLLTDEMASHGGYAPGGGMVVW